MRQEGSILVVAGSGRIPVLSAFSRIASGHGDRLQFFEANSEFLKKIGRQSQDQRPIGAGDQSRTGNFGFADRRFPS
jgi:hypothetical protein